MTAETTTATPAPGATPAADATPVDATAAETTTATDAASPETTAPEAQVGDVGARLIAEARKAAREADRRAKDAETKLREREEADLSEQQRSTLRLAELEAERTAWLAERQSVYLTAAVTQLSQRLALVDVDAVVRLLDRDALDFDDHGQPTNTEELVRALLRSKPYLAGVRQANPVQIGTTEGTTTAPAPSLMAEELEAARAAGLTPERYAALRSVRTIEDWQATRRQSTTGR
jgi:hypothetical protein